VLNIAAVTDLVKSDHQIASRMIAECLNFPMAVVLQVLKEDLGKRNPVYMPMELIMN
jgi:hypothetical protein